MHADSTKPTVSVLLPTHNGVRWVRFSILSVLNQTYENFELIVIDDGSTDGTAQVVTSLADPRVRYVKNDTNLGIQRTLNRGLSEAGGKYIARIDDDDFWIDREKLEKQVTFLENNPDYVLLGTSVVVSDEEGKEKFRFQPPQDDGAIRRALLSRNCFTHSSVLFKSETVRSFGGYGEGEEVRHLEDYDLWLKLGTVGKLANLPDYAVRFTERGNSLSSQNRAIQYWRDILLVKRFRTSYPGYLRGLTVSYIRFWGYHLLRFLPFRNLILRLYKTM